MADARAGVMDSANQYTGGLSFSSVALQLGAQNGAQVNGGFSFDLPLSTVAMFTNRALDFSAANSRNAQGFLGGVISNTQSNVSQSSQSALDFMNSGVSQLAGMNTMNQFSANYRANLYQPPSSGGGCFITTAICEARQLPDDCEELQILREFRDTYMLASCKGRNLVREYYAIAPQIAARLSYEQCESLRVKYLIPALTFISVGDFQNAEQIYTLMVREASRLTGVKWTT